MTIKTHNKVARIALGVAISVIVISVICAFVVSKRASERKKCIADGNVYVESSRTCREKTVFEKFDEQCTSGIDVGDRHYSCKEVYDKGLAEAYVNNKTIIRHGDDIYERGTILEVLAGQRVGDYCLSASDTWGYIGQTRCVVFTPRYLARSGYNFFLDEKDEDHYREGFTVYMYGNYDWNWFSGTYGKGDELLICGQITTYQGHPQIRTNPNSILVSPNKTQDGPYTVYRYSCD